MTYLVVNHTEEYDPTSNTWINKTDMPTSRALFGTAVYQNKIYCIGGYNGATIFYGPESWDWKTEYYNVAANELYDPSVDTWQTLPPLPTPRYSAATNTVNGKIYVIGGRTMTDLSTALNVTEVYDPITNSWTKKAPPPLSVATSGSAVIDNKIYVLGKNPQAAWQNTLEIYDPSADAWTIGEPVPVGYAATAAATTGMNAAKRIYFFDENRTDVYDPITNSWSTGAKAPTTNRLIARAAVVDDTVYLIGGRTGQWGYMTFMYPSTLNEQYFPVGYGTPDLSTPPPPPTSPPPTPLSADPPQTPSSSPEAPSLNNEPAVSTTTAIAVACGVTVAVAGLGLTLFLKRKNSVRL